MFKEFKKIDASSEYLRQYWDGAANMLVRYKTYFFDGLNLVNEGKYLIGLLGLGIFKSDIVLKWQVLLVGLVIGLPIITLVGRWNLFFANKARQFITKQHGDIAQFQGHNMQVTQIALLAAIAEKMGVDIEKIKTELGVK